MSAQVRFRKESQLDLKVKTIGNSEVGSFSTIFDSKGSNTSMACKTSKKNKVLII